MDTFILPIFIKKKKKRMIACGAQMLSRGHFCEFFQSTLPFFKITLCSCTILEMEKRALIFHCAMWQHLICTTRKETLQRVFMFVFLLPDPDKRSALYLLGISASGEQRCAPA